MSRVFVIQDDGRRDFSGAKRFGALVPLIERDTFPDDADQRSSTIGRIMRTKLQSFDPLHDYLLLTGDPVAIVIAGLSVASFGVEVFKCLKWDRENNGYYPVTVTA